MAFNFGSTINSVARAATGALGSVGGALQTASKLAGALNNLSNPAALISSLRSINLPKGGEAGGVLKAASAAFGGADADGDWRVKLSIPSSFASSPLMQRLVQTGGLVFPYTPSITISSAANYEDTVLTHQNYQFVSYQNSRTNDIQIEAPFNVEDGDQAMYWLAAVRCLQAKATYKVTHLLS